MMLYHRIIFISAIFIAILSILLISEPGFNGSSPGCSGGGCHGYSAGEISVTTDGLQVEVSLPNVPQGEKVAGELVNEAGQVVTTAGATQNNPFTLTATEPGTYLVNAGFKKPARDWDSVSVTLTVSGLENSVKPAVLSQYELYDNHPNPFNNETLIRFNLPGQEMVQLKIFNVNGQVVRTLVNNNLSAGTHSVRWNGKDEQGQLVASGLYLYQLSAGGKRMTKRLILAK